NFVPVQSKPSLDHGWPRTNFAHVQSKPSLDHKLLPTNFLTRAARLSGVDGGGSGGAGGRGSGVFHDTRPVSLASRRQRNASMLIRSQRSIWLGGTHTQPG